MQYVLRPRLLIVVSGFLKTFTLPILLNHNLLTAYHKLTEGSLNIALKDSVSREGEGFSTPFEYSQINFHMNLINLQD